MNSRYYAVTLAAILIMMTSFAGCGRPSGRAEKGHGLAGKHDAGIEIPAPSSSRPEVTIHQEGFTIAFNTQTNEPDWVAWELTRSELEGKSQRHDQFSPDPKAPQGHQVQSWDYSRSGYDRGHMAPAGDMTWSEEAMQASFYMTNVCPQDHILNGKGWNSLEIACRRWAQREGAVYIVCGPIFENMTGGASTGTTIGKQCRIMVPDAFFKAVVTLGGESKGIQDGSARGIGFIYSNTSEYQTMDGTATTIDAIEAITGYDLFPGLPDNVENVIETQNNLHAWR